MNLISVSPWQASLLIAYPMSLSWLIRSSSYANVQNRILSVWWESPHHIQRFILRLSEKQQVCPKQLAVALETEYEKETWTLKKQEDSHHQEAGRELDPAFPLWTLGEPSPSDKARLREKHRHGFQQ